MLLLLSVSTLPPTAALMKLQARMVLVMMPTLYLVEWGGGEGLGQPGVSTAQHRSMITRRFEAWFFFTSTL